MQQTYMDLVLCEGPAERALLVHVDALDEKEDVAWGTDGPQDVRAVEP